MGYSIGGVQVPADVFVLLADGPGPDDSIHDMDWAEAEYQRLKTEQPKDSAYSLEICTANVWVKRAGSDEWHSEQQRRVNIIDRNDNLYGSDRAVSPEHEAELISELAKKYKISADRITIG